MSIAISMSSLKVFKILNSSVVCVVLFLLINSCGQKISNQNTSLSSVPGVDDKFESKIRYAKHFKIEHHAGWKEVLVIDPWKGDTLGHYALVLRGSVVPSSLPVGATLVYVPVKNIACLSSTHVGSLVLLGLGDKINGVSNIDKIMDTTLQLRIKAGKITDIGRQMNNNLEQILALAPEVLMKSGYDNVRNDDSRIAGAKIPIAYNVEWMEPDLMARAEWLKFVSAFFCKERMADSIFRSIELRYDEAEKLAKSVSYRPKVLFGTDYKGEWHISGSESYVAKMLSDAGAHFEPNGLKGTQPLSFEQVLEIHADDDIWLNWMTPNISSVEKLGKMNERYKLFKAYRTGEVYNHDKRTNAAGGNDFWESGVSRPDLIMKDLVRIMHPELLPDYEMVYWRKLPKTDKAK